jgi:hypothetical protein
VVTPALSGGNIFDTGIDLHGEPAMTANRTQPQPVEPSISN